MTEGEAENDTIPDAECAVGETASAAADDRAETLGQALAAAALPAWRKAYLANLIASGRRFAEAGNGRGADYCLAKVEDSLRDLPSVAASQPMPKSHPSERPADRLRSRWRRDRIDHAEKVLDVHGAHLSRLEKQTYRERLDKLREDAERPSQAVQADAGLLDLRRRLYQRVLKAQKASILRKRAPARPPRPQRPSATPSAWQPVTGPYNDRSNIEELLSVIGGADPAWVEEFVELYGALLGLNALVASAAPKQ